MTTNVYLLLFSSVDLARQIGFGALLTAGRKLARRIGCVLTALNQDAYIDERTLKDLGISRAQAEFELSRSPWRLPPY
jgi:uncharacterized protein YjiS (DUF1127 family)